MTNTTLFFFFAGVVFIGISVWRLTRRRLERGKSYSDYIKNVKLKPPAEDEFGRTVRWVINEKREAGQHSARTEPPAETGR